MTKVADWFAHSHASEALPRQLTAASLARLQQRAEQVAVLGEDATAWRARQAETRASLEQVGIAITASLPPTPRRPCSGPLHRLSRRLAD